MPLCEFYARQRPVQLRCLCSFAQSTSTSRRRSQPPVTGCVCLCRAAADLRPLFYLSVCVCVCALVFVRGSGCASVCVCVRVLSWISSSAAAVPDSYITRPKKVSWLARVYFAFVARRVHTSLARNTHRIQTDRIRIRIRIRIRLRNDLRHGLRIQFCDSESASEFRALRLQFIACCLSVSLACDSVCARVCVYLFISVLANWILIFFSVLVVVAQPQKAQSE